MQNFNCNITVHSTNARFPQTPLPEVNHRALTCVLQLYERQATEFSGMENRDTLSFQHEREKEKSQWKDSVKSDLKHCLTVSSFTEFVLAAVKGRNLQWKCDITERGNITDFPPNGKQFWERCKKVMK